jgi:hypothetical protein
VQIKNSVRALSLIGHGVSKSEIKIFSVFSTLTPEKYPKTGADQKFREGAFPHWTWGIEIRNKNFAAKFSKFGRGASRTSDRVFLRPCIRPKPQSAFAS